MVPSADVFVPSGPAFRMLPQGIVGAGDAACAYGVQAEVQAQPGGVGGLARRAPHREDAGGGRAAGACGEEWRLHDRVLTVHTWHINVNLTVHT